MDWEERYFLNLVYLARAANKSLKTFHQKQLAEIRAHARSLKAQLKNEIELKPEDLARFHSTWHYSGVRLLTSIPGHSKIPQIAEKLKLDPALVREVIEFLVENGLCVKQGDGYSMGPQRTHLPSDSPLLKTRQISWRLKGFERMGIKTEDDLFFTAPMALSKAAKDEIHNELKKMVIAATDVAAKSESEVLNCLNIDWFEI